MIAKKEMKKVNHENEIIKEQNIPIEEFRAKFTETLKALSKYREAYINGKNGNVQPMRTK